MCTYVCVHVCARSHAGNALQAGALGEAQMWAVSQLPKLAGWPMRVRGMCAHPGRVVPAASFRARFQMHAWRSPLLGCPTATCGHRCDFLREAAARAGLHNVDVVWSRAEEAGRKPELRQVGQPAPAGCVS